MFSIFNVRSRREIDLSAIMVDMHSHLLPGIDDGSTDVENSIQLVDGLISLGFQKLITTPHILWDLYQNTHQSISEAKGRLPNSLPIFMAAEYMIDDYFSSLLQKKEPLLTLKGNLVLVEFSFVSLPFDWKQVFFDLQVNGYQPVLAHPERYTYLAAQPAIFHEITDMGVLLQVNLNSLTGYYGKPSLHLAQFLSKHKLISFLGTDLHHHRHLDALRQSKQLMENIQPILDSGKMLNSTLL
ncbi:histidinol phosphatase [Flavihumibacter sediminis]|nr:histidinol phosphatase [Flavihumibacter sediminis]